MVDIISDSENRIFNLFEEEVKPFSDEIDSPFATVKGFVIDNLGNPLEGALVKLMSLTYEPILHNTTDATGEYKISNVEANVYKIYAIHKGKILPEGDIITATPSQEIEKNFVLENDPDMKLALIAGDVFDQSSKDVLKKALVTLYSINNNEEYLVANTETNNYGQFTFRDIQLDNYKITIGYTGYNTITISVNTINEGQIIFTKIGLTPSSNGTVSGVIKDEQNLPINEADVILYKVEDDEKLTPIQFTKTNNEGVYLFQDIEKATYKIKANEATKVSIISPNSPNYYSFSIANASTIIPNIISINNEANLYQGAEYVYDRKFVRYIGGVNDGYMTINITALFSGYYNISIKYLSLGIVSTLTLKQDPDNNGKETILRFPGTLSWNIEDAKSITVRLSLHAGINKFKIFAKFEPFTPWIGDFSLSYVKHSYSAETIDGIVGNKAIYIPPFITNLGGKDNGNVTIPVDIPFTQPYNLKIQYLSGDTNRPLKIDVDEVNKANIIVLKTNDWTIGSTRIYEVTIEAEEGLRYFKFYNDTGDPAPNIGNLTFEEHTIDKTFMPKDVVLLDGANIKTDISGVHYIDGINLKKGKIKFSIKVFETQLYDFQIAYKCSDDRTCIVEVNDRIITEREFIFSKTGNNLGLFNSKLFLNQGVNTISIYNE